MLFSRWLAMARKRLNNSQESDGELFTELKTELQQKHNNNNLKSDNYLYEFQFYPKPNRQTSVHWLRLGSEYGPQALPKDRMRRGIGSAERWREAHSWLRTCVHCSTSALHCLNTEPTFPSMPTLGFWAQVLLSWASLSLLSMLSIRSFDGILVSPPRS